MNELSDEVRIQRGVRQGSVASPILSIYTRKKIQTYYQYGGCQRGGQKWNENLYHEDQRNGSQQETKFTKINIAIDGLKPT